MSGTLQDMKAALRSGAKPQFSHVRSGVKTYIARNCEYGSDKYERANYLRPTPSIADDFERLRGYAEAAERHLTGLTDSLERHQALDPLLEDVEGMKRAAYAADEESGLPHVGGLVTSAMMLIEQAIQCGLLPKDPGQPWKKRPMTMVSFDPAGDEVVGYALAPPAPIKGTITMRVKTATRKGDLITLDDVIVDDIETKSDEQIADEAVRQINDQVAGLEYSATHPDGKLVEIRSSEHGHEVSVDGKICFGAVGKDTYKRAIDYVNMRARREQEKIDRREARKVQAL